MNTFGKNFKITVFGESHGRCIGVVVEGCPPGLRINSADIQKEVEKRKPAQSIISTSRQETDKVEILSGVFKGYTTGAPICLIVFNQEKDSSPYEKIRHLPRPGHADLTAFLKYQGFNDYRGGGMFSGRLTLAYVMAGAIAKKILAKKKIEIVGYTIQIGKIKAISLDIETIKRNKEKNLVRCGDLKTAKAMEKLILATKAVGDSVGGVIECQVLNLPPGVGEPIFGNLESEIARIVFAIPAVKGIEFGSGFEGARLKGSENNDSFCIRKGKIVTTTNNCGGILGGISNGMPLVFRVAIKPTPSIAKPQRTINLWTRRSAILKIEGRHDPCIVPRAVPVVEAVTAIVMADHLK